MTVTFVTQNKNKLGAIKAAFEPFNIDILQEAIDTIEIQADTTDEVVLYSANYISDLLKKDIIKQDSGFCIEALNNFPGPYAKYVEQTLDADGILRLMNNISNRRAYFIDSFVYKPYQKEAAIFTHKTYGTITYEKLGTDGVGYDFIFIPDGYNQTLAQMDENTRHKVWNQEAYQKLAEYIKKES